MQLVPLYRDPRSPLPVTQFNMKWVEQAGLVKFDFLGLKTLTVLEKAVELIRRRGVDDRPRRDPARRRADLRDAGARRDGRHLPGGRVGHAPRAGRHAARPLRGPDRARRPLPAGADGEHPALLRRKLGKEETRLHPSEARADPEGDLRRHHLPGAGDADRARSRRLQARRGRSAAPRHGQEDPRGDGAAARALHLRRGRARHRARRCGGDLRCLREVRRLRLQQIALGALCADHLPDGLSEGELSRSSSWRRR